MSKTIDLETFTAEELLECPLEPVKWIVEDIIAVGFTIFGGAPKIGKSWAALQLGLCVSKGEKFLDSNTKGGHVIYLALEDNRARLQRRLFQITDEANEQFHFTTYANDIENGLFAQLENFLDMHPDTVLAIIDTLQTIRSASYDGSYSADYSVGTALHKFAMEKDIAIVAIHHTRKMEAQDILDQLLGTRGAVGSADAALVLTRDNRFDGNAKLSIDGRDVTFTELKLRFNNGTWEFIERTSQEELVEREKPAAVLTVLDFMSARTMGWAGTATALIKEAGIQDVKPNVLAKYLNEHRDFLLSRGVEYTRDRTGAARTMYLEKVPVEVPDEQ